MACPCAWHCARGGFELARARTPELVQTQTDVCKRSFLPDCVQEADAAALPRAPPMTPPPSSSTSVGPIVGGVIGALAGIGVCIAMLLLCWWRRSGRSERSGRHATSPKLRDAAGGRWHRPGTTSANARSGSASTDSGSPPIQTASSLETRSDMVRDARPRSSRATCQPSGRQCSTMQHCDGSAVTPVECTSL